MGAVAGRCVRVGIRCHIVWPHDVLERASRMALVRDLMEFLAYLFPIVLLALLVIATIAVIRWRG